MEFGVSNIENVVESAIEKFKNNPCIEKIKETFVDKNIFSFDVSLDRIFKEIVSLDSNKTTHSNDLPTKIFKQMPIYLQFTYRSMQWMSFLGLFRLF